jgi:hypothetical protein
VELSDLKVVYLNDILAVLDLIVYSKERNSMAIDDCQICMESYLEGSQYYKIPGCNHLFCVECTRNWFDSKNQEREQRCPFCNLVLEIEVLRKEKQERVANDPDTN